MGRIVVLGIDGLGWRIALKLRPIMQCLDRLLSVATCRKVSSTFPPATAPSWFSIATGLDPIDEGLYDFFVPYCEDGAIRLRLVSSRDFEGRSIWDYASRLGMRIALVGYPLLYPPYPINGIMITGLGSPRDYAETYPPELENELKSRGLLYRTYIPYLDYENVENFLRDCTDNVSKIRKLLDMLIDKFDIVIAVVQASDWVLHRCFKMLEERLEKFERFWEEVDRIIERAVEHVEEGEGDLVIVSDHGFDRCLGYLNLPLLLEKLNILKTTKLKLIGAVYSTVRDLVPRRSTSTYSRAVNLVVRLVSKDKIFTLPHSNNLGAVYSRDLTAVRRIYIELKCVFQSLGMSFKARIVRQCGNLYALIFTLSEGRVLVKNFFIDDEDSRRKILLDPPMEGAHSPDAIVLTYGKNVEKAWKLCRDVKTVRDVYRIVKTLLDISKPFQPV